MIGDDNQRKVRSRGVSIISWDLAFKLLTFLCDSLNSILQYLLNVLRCEKLCAFFFVEQLDIF
jgi:hypothetical protein